MTFLKFLPIVLSVLVGVQPTTRFLLDVKPLELSILSNDYCEYGLGRPPPQKWCVCWGKIDLEIEVLPWDCDTYAPKLTYRRRKRDRNSKWEMGNFLNSVYTRNNLFPQDLFKAGSQWKNPIKFEDKFVEKIKEHKKSLFDKGLRVIFKEDQPAANSSLENGRKFMLKEVSGRDSYYDSLLLASALLVPFLHPYVDYPGREGSPLDQSISALKLLLLGLEDARSIEDLELYLLRTVAFLKIKFLMKFKNSVVAELEELLRILKGKNVTAIDSKNDSTSTNNTLWDVIRKGMPHAGDPKDDSFPKPIKTANSGLKIGDLNWLKNSKDAEKILNSVGFRKNSKIADFVSNTIAKAIILAGMQKNLSDLDSTLMKILLAIRNPVIEESTVSPGKSPVMSKLPKSEDSGRLMSVSKIPPQDGHAFPSDSFDNSASPIRFPIDSAAESTENSFARPKIQVLVNLVEPKSVNSRTIENGTLKTVNPSPATNENCLELGKHESSFNNTVCLTELHGDSSTKKYEESSAGPKIQAASISEQPKAVNYRSIENDTLEGEGPSEPANDGNSSELVKCDSSVNNSVNPPEKTKDSVTEKSRGGSNIRIPAHIKFLNARSLKNVRLETGVRPGTENGNSSGNAKRNSAFNDTLTPIETPKDSPPDESYAKSSAGPKIREPANTKKPKSAKSRSLKNMKNDTADAETPSQAAKGYSAELKREPSFGNSVPVKLQNADNLQHGYPNLKIVDIDLMLNESTPKNSNPKNSDGLKYLPRPADARH